MSKLNCVEEYSWNELRGFIKNRELKKYCSKGSIKQIRDLIDDKKEEKKQLRMWADGSMKRIIDGPGPTMMQIGGRDEVRRQLGLDVVTGLPLTKKAAEQPSMSKSEKRAETFKLAAEKMYKKKNEIRLEKMTIVELVADAKKNGIKGYSGKNKRALIEYIKQRNAELDKGRSKKN